MCAFEEEIHFVLNKQKHVMVPSIYLNDFESQAKLGIKYRAVLT
jgi:hypothetical protein